MPRHGLTSYGNVNGLFRCDLATILIPGRTCPCEMRACMERKFYNHRHQLARVHSAPEYPLPVFDSCKISDRIDQARRSVLSAARRNWSLPRSIDGRGAAVAVLHLRPGGGKTTLLHELARLAQQGQSVVLLDGRDVESTPTAVASAANGCSIDGRSRRARGCSSTPTRCWTAGWLGCVRICRIRLLPAWS